MAIRFPRVMAGNLELSEAGEFHQVVKLDVNWPFGFRDVMTTEIHRFKIDNGVPFPVRHTGHMGMGPVNAAIFETMGALESGQSFLIPCKINDPTDLKFNHERQMTMSRIYMMRKRLAPKHFATRKNLEGVRVWRLE